MRRGRADARRLAGGGRSPARARRGGRDADIGESPEPTPADAIGELRPEPDEIALRAAEDSIVAGEIGDLLPGQWRGRQRVRGRGAKRRDVGATSRGGEEPMPEAAAALSDRHYKIQEVVKRRQIMLVQVAKEERGNKGAALTTYLSLAGAIAC